MFLFFPQSAPLGGTAVTAKGHASARTGACVTLPRGHATARLATSALTAASVSARVSRRGRGELAGVSSAGGEWWWGQILHAAGLLTLRETRSVPATDPCVGPSAEKELLVPLYNLRCQQCPPRFSTEAGVRSASRTVGMQLQLISFAVCLNRRNICLLRLFYAKMISPL